MPSSVSSIIHSILTCIIIECRMVVLRRRRRRLRRCHRRDRRLQDCHHHRRRHLQFPRLHHRHPGL
jgi:hypothetical protein